MLSPGSFTVRRATADDLDELGRMGAALVRLHHEWDADRFFNRPGIARGYRSYFASQLPVKETIILVAEQQGRLIGYAYASLLPRDWSDLRDPCGKIHDLFVTEAARGAGAGRALLEATVRQLEALGVPRVILMVAARNPAARRLFAGAGFRETMIEMTREAAGKDH